jgi:hypothetical protein
MKITRHFPHILLICLLFLSACSVASTKGVAANGTDIEALLKSRNFIFKAQTANPMRGSMRQLTSAYDLVLANDSLRTFLPYFGRAYAAPSYNGEGGIRLSTTDFEYNISDKRKKRWNITLKPNSDKSIQQMILSVSENGYANLRVMSINRDPISFNGVVTARK